MDGIWQDLRFGLRILIKHRQFTIAAVSILALGIGVTTAVFSVVNAVLLRPLPYAEPSRLVAITSVYKGSTPSVTPVVKLTDVAEWRTRVRSFASIGAFAYTQLPLRVGDRSLSPVTALMDPEFLPTLGTPLQLGTFFDRGAKSDATAMISHALWVDAFGSDPAAIGVTVSIDGAPFVIRGVLPPGFQFPRSDASYFTKPVDLLMPASSFEGFPQRARQWFAIGRLGSDVAPERAASELQVVAEGLSRASDGGDLWSAQLSPLDEETTRRSRQPLLVVLAISFVLLLIASTNLMNLFFSRGTVRIRELAIRRAVGSTMGQLVRQLLVESLLVAFVGGSIGVLLARLAIGAIVDLSPVHLPVTGAISIDRTVLMFTVIVCAGAALIAGLLPALRIGVDADHALRGSGTRTSAGPAVARFQQRLCVFQIALGVSLLAVSGLLAHSLWRLSAVDPGFNPRQVLGFNLSVPSGQSMAERKRFYARALDELRTIPGVERAGMISFLPPELRAGVFMGLGIDGVPPPERGSPPRVVNTLVASPGYFATMQMPIVGGRDLGSVDTAASPPVIVVNEALARRYFPRGDALGRRIGTGFDGLKPVREIVGIVRDTHDRGLAAEPVPTVYIAFEQFALPYTSFVVRTRAATASVVPIVRDRLNRLNASAPVTDFQMLEERMHESLREPRFYTVMAIACAAMALFFVTFGLYGLVSYSVSRRTPELGIRMALGARRVDVLRMVLLQGLRMSAAGVVAGVVVAAVCSRLLQAQLFHVQPLDPLTLGLTAALAIVVTVAATLAPAYRASRVNPLAALRSE